MSARAGERPRRPDRYALLEMRALVERIALLRDDGGRQRYFAEEDHRWLIHRLWIAVGNEAVAYAQAVGLDPYHDEPWNRLRRLRNDIAHKRLADLDDEGVWRTTQVRPEGLLARIAELIQRDLPIP